MHLFYLVTKNYEELRFMKIAKYEIRRQDLIFNPNTTFTIWVLLHDKLLKTDCMVTGIVTTKENGFAVSFLKSG